jgi:molybdopterin molybdotransferase
MISFENGQNRILEKSVTLNTVDIPIEQASGYSTSGKIVSGEDQPMFDSSAVDGYAIGTAELPDDPARYPVRLRVAGSIQAGDTSIYRLGTGTAMRIMTGAPLPEGADAVIMKEKIRCKGDFVDIMQSVKTGANIRFCGEEISGGTMVLEPGTRLRPAEIGLLATLGYVRISVVRKPIVTVVTTGNELRYPGDAPVRGTIRDSNSYFLISALKEIGVERIVVHSCVRDTVADLKRPISRGIEESDVVVVTGGISVGDHDLVKEVIESCGVKREFWRMNIKPGKPVYFGTYGKKLIFGLPGNPVAVSVLYYELVQPALRKMAGEREFLPPRLHAHLLKEIRKGTDRRELVRGRVAVNGDKVSVMPNMKRGSHMMSSLTGANCLIHFSEKISILPEGTAVAVDLINERMRYHC